MLNIGEAMTMQGANPCPSLITEHQRVYTLCFATTIGELGITTGSAVRSVRQCLRAMASAASLAVTSRGMSPVCMAAGTRSARRRRSVSTVMQHGRGHYKRMKPISNRMSTFVMVNIRLSPEELQEYRGMALEAGKSFSAHIRDILRLYATHHKRTRNSRKPTDT